MTDSKYPDVVVDLIGGDGNAFAILGAVRGALWSGGHADVVDEFYAEATGGGYEELLATCVRWVTVR